MKKIVKTQIKSLDSINSYESKAIYHQNTLKYKEDDVTVVMEINDDNIVLKRHNNDFNYTFTFNKNNSFLEYTLNLNNYKFKIDFKTDELVTKDDKIFISYTLEDIKYTYEVIIREEL